MTIETEEQLEAMRRIGRIVADCLQMMLSVLEDGMSTAELDQLGRQYLEAQGARSAPELMYQFPGATCISLEHEAAHGVPSPSRIIRPNMLINIDVSAELNGYFADTGASYVYRSDDRSLHALCQATRRALKSAISEVKAGVPLNRIGKAIEKEARRSSCKILQNLCSHGVGRSLHEDPTEIPSYFDPGDRRIIHSGLVFTIEPFLTTGSEQAYEASDQWTLMNPKPYFSAQYEHTIVATRKGALILTQPSQGAAFLPNKVA